MIEEEIKAIEALLAERDRYKRALESALGTTVGVSPNSSAREVPAPSRAPNVVFIYSTTRILI